MVSHDKHLGVNFSRAVLPKGPPPGGPDVDAMRRQMERINCGFEKAERLPANIGYLKFNMFAKAGYLRTNGDRRDELSGQCRCSHH